MQKTCNQGPRILPSWSARSARCDRRPARGVFSARGVFLVAYLESGGEFFFQVGAASFSWNCAAGFFKAARARSLTRLEAEVITKRWFLFFGGIDDQPKMQRHVLIGLALCSLGQSNANAVAIKMHKIVGGVARHFDALVFVVAELVRQLVFSIDMKFRLVASLDSEGDECLFCLVAAQLAFDGAVVVIPQCERSIVPAVLIKVVVVFAIARQIPRSAFGKVDSFGNGRLCVGLALLWRHLVCGEVFFEVSQSSSFSRNDPGMTLENEFPGMTLENGFLIPGTSKKTQSHFRRPSLSSTNKGQ